MNYANLNDVEFEYLCQDILSRMLNVELRRFAPGRDGGIDLVDDILKKSTVVQVKHYIKTDISGLLTSLRREVAKVSDLNPSQYYVCCSKELSADKISEIYCMFEGYMESERNVITLIEIDNFLNQPDNIDIVRKHYKLWISSTNILEEIYNNDIFIDCEVLLSNIDRAKKFFVQTEVYNCALKCLLKNKTLFITGNPGVGKSVTSKMLVLYYAAQGYRVRYTTDGADLSGLKRALSSDPNTKEIILLDDCFGQAYFNMRETQGNELLSLIKYVNLTQNKILILNSRVTIYQEAKVITPELVRSFENKEYNLQIIDIDALSIIEKAKILYNHLYFNNIGEEYLKSIKQDKNYLKIVKHQNYNPRIIEFISNCHRLNEINPSEYSKFILEHLDNPDKVWNDEYERKLSRGDRILLTTLFSLTNTTVSLTLVEKCFNERIKNIPDIDKTINHFQNSLSRLQEGFVKVVYEKRELKLSMINPSINDYIDSRLRANSVERNDLIDNAFSVAQLKKLLSPQNFNIKMNTIFDSGLVIEYYFCNYQEKAGYIASYIVLNKILDSRYQAYIYDYLANITYVDIYEKQNVRVSTILQELLMPDICSFYNIKVFLSDFRILEQIFSKLRLDELADVIYSFYSLYQEEEEFISMCQQILKEAIELDFCNVSADDFDLDIGTAIKDIYKEGDYENIDIDLVVDYIEDEIEYIVKQQINDYIVGLPLKFHSLIPVTNNINISNASGFVESYLCQGYDDYDAYDDYYSHTRQVDYTEIDMIFNR